MTHYNLVHKFIPMPRAMKIPDAKAAQGVEKARDNPSIATGTSQKQEEGYSRRTERSTESSLCYIGGHMSPLKMRS